MCLRDLKGGTERQKVEDRRRRREFEPKGPGDRSIT